MVVPQDFIRLVAEMRSAQKEYFRTGSDASLALAKSLERQVDIALRDMTQQQRLFEEEV